MLGSVRPPQRPCRPRSAERFPNREETGKVSLHRFVLCRFLWCVKDIDVGTSFEVARSAAQVRTSPSHLFGVGVGAFVVGSLAFDELEDRTPLKWTREDSDRRYAQVMLGRPFRATPKWPVTPFPSRANRLRVARFWLLLFYSLHNDPPDNQWWPSAHPDNGGRFL
jgi:hypothetical protein